MIDDDLDFDARPEAGRDRMPTNPITPESRRERLAAELRENVAFWEDRLARHPEDALDWADHLLALMDPAESRREDVLAALRPWLRHHIWCNCKTDDPPNTERCKCGLRAALASSPDLSGLRRALVEAVLPLEVIAAQNRAKPYRELSPELIEDISRAIGIVREALDHSGTDDGLDARERVFCRCGRSVLAENWANHLLRQSDGPHERHECAGCRRSRTRRAAKLGAALGPGE